MIFKYQFVCQQSKASENEENLLKIVVQVLSRVPLSQLSDVKALSWHVATDLRVS
jgi:hypothetical protein